jgi:hypothetical protein
MSSVTSPSIITDGLILNIDAQNIKSYKGPVLTNLATAMVAQGLGTATGYVSTGGTEVVNIPQLGNVTTAYNFIQNNYTSFAPNSGACCPSLVSYSIGGVPVLPSTVYTYAIVYKCDSGYTNPNYMYHYEYNSGTYVSEGGVFTTANRIHLGNGWYWAWNTFTTGATTNTLVGPAAFYYYYSQYADKFSVAKVLIAQGDWTQMHPKYWPPVYSGTTNTASVFDMTSNNAITTNAATYANDGSYSFNGSTNYFTMPENAVFNTQSPSVEVWVKVNSTAQNGFFFEKGNVNTQYALFLETGQIVWRQYLAGAVTNITAPAATYINTSQYAHIVGTYTSGSRCLYVNGTLIASDTSTGTVNVNANGCSIGVYGGQNGTVGGRNYFFNGSIGSVKVYNRALTAIEVKQNFNANRGRYGI